MFVSIKTFASGFCFLTAEEMDERTSMADGAWVGLWFAPVEIQTPSAPF
jgi:hypothetical protein